MSTLLDKMQWRYAAKKMDANKEVAKVFSQGVCKAG